MAQQQGIAKGDALQRLASLGFIIGGLLLLVFNLLLPRPTDPSNVQDTLTTWGNKAGLVALSGFFIAVGNWGMMIGSAGIYRSISGKGAAWARLGFYGVIVGTAILTVSSGILAATANAAADWLAATGASKDAAYNVAAAVNVVSWITFTMAVLVNWLAIFFLGIGMVCSSIYPKWQGWFGLLLGIVTVVAVGIPQFFAGVTGTVQVLFAVLGTLTVIWALVVGIWLARKAW